MQYKDLLWKLAKPAARVLLPHWRAKPCTLSPQTAAARVQAVYTPAPLFTPAQPVSPLPPEQLTVSVIVPVYNAAAFLERCIGSLATQCTQQRIEIIAVDDGSTDDSPAVLRTLAQKYTRLKIITQENRGISAARNAGIAVARGRYLCFVDNDDFVAPGFVDTLLDAAQKNSADLVKCGYRVYNEDTARYAGQKSDTDAVVHGPLGDAAAQYNGFIWGCLFHRDLFAQIRFPEGYWYEDMIMRVLLLRKSRCFVNLRAALYTHSEHRENASKAVWANTSSKSMDQYFLAAGLARYGEQIGLGTENGLYAVLLEEFGTQLRTRTAALAPDLCEAVFVLACDCLDRYRPAALPHLTRKQTVLHDALQRRDKAKWALGCLL